MQKKDFDWFGCAGRDEAKSIDTPNMHLACLVIIGGSTPLSSFNFI